MKKKKLKMKNFLNLKVTKCIENFVVKRILQRRQIEGDQIDLARLTHLLLRFGVAFLRCSVFYRRVGFVMSNSEVRYRKGFRTDGLFTIESGCLIDCYGDVGVIVGRNFKLGRNSVISVPGSYLSKGEGVVIGRNVGLGDFSYIGGEALVEIGDNTISGQYLSVHPENHIFNKGQLFTESGTSKIGIKVGNNVWLGAKVTLLDGCLIGSNSIVAAGSVVKGEFPRNSIIAGVPARVIGSNGH